MINQSTNLLYSPVSLLVDSHDDDPSFSTINKKTISAISPCKEILLIDKEYVNRESHRFYL